MYKVQYPPNVQWEVTSLCNHNCIHCYNYWRTDVVQACDCVHSEEEYLMIAKAIAKNKPVSVTITGGEPLIVFDKIKPAIEYLKANNIVVSFNSNAALITDSIAKYCRDNEISFFVSFPCSNEDVCDSITGVKGSFNKIMEGINKLKEYEVKFVLNMVVSHLNIDYLYETAEFVKKVIKQDYFFITKPSRPINSSTAFDKNLLSLEDVRNMLRETVKIQKELNLQIQSACTYPLCTYEDQESFEMFAYKKVCVAGKVFYAVGFDGEVRACARDITSYGNILTDNFEDIWGRMECWRDGSLIPKECKDCKSKMQCLGGCRIDGYQYTGRLDSLDTSTDLENKEIQFIPKDDRMFEKIILDKQYHINPKALFVKESSACRASVEKRFIYLKYNLYDFIMSKKTFSANDAKQYFAISEEESKKVIFMLLYSGIIV